MSTDLHDRARQPPPDGRPQQPEKPKSPISIAQVVGGALAAMTAAALGSRLSLAGTVIGAAFASVIAALAGALYTASLRRTSQGVSAVLTRVRTTSGDTAPGSAPAGTTSTTAVDGTPAEPWVLPAQPDGPATGSTPAQTTPARIGWKTVVVAAVLMFVVAALALTGLELATGQALSGGSGTTLGQVADPGTRPSATPTHRVTAGPSTTPSSTTSTEPSATATAAATATSSSEPTAEPSASSTATPSTTPTPTPTSTPTSSGSPSGATPTS